MASDSSISPTQTSNESTAAAPTVLLLKPQEQKHPQNSGWTFYLIYSIFAAVVGTLFMLGYSVVVINEPYDVISQFLNESISQQHNRTITEHELNTQWSLVSNVFLIGGVLGCAWVPEAMANRFGRNRSLLYAAPFGAFGTLLCFIAPYTGSYLPLYFGRFIVGYHAGFATVVVPALLVELPPVNLRGAVGSLSELPYLFGCTLANVVGLPYILGNESWNMLFLVGAAFYVAHALLLIPAAESPRWLIDRQREKDAFKVLKKLRNSHDTDSTLVAEYEATKAVAAAEADIRQISIKDFFRKRQLWWPLILSITLAFGQQLTGLTAIYIYSSEVLIKAGFDDHKTKMANLGLSFVNIGGTIISMAISDRIGRRLFFLLGLLAIGLSHIIVTAGLVFEQFYASIIGFAIFRFGYSIGPGPITWYMPAEMFNQEARPLALSICLFINWFCSFSCCFIFPPLMEHLGNYSFMPFAGFAFLVLAFLFAFLPETKGIPVEDIVASFQSGKPLIQIGKGKSTSMKGNTCAEEL